MEISIAETDKFRLPDYVSHRVIDGECVLLNADNNHYYSLNDTGTVIYELILDGQSFSEIKVELEKQSQGSVPLSTISSDIEELLMDLLNEGLIEKITGE